MRRREPTFLAAGLLRDCLTMTWLLLGLTCVGCGRWQSPPRDATNKPEQKAPVTDQPTPHHAVVEQGPATAQGVLKRMVAAYKKASSYADVGTIHMVIEQGERKVDESADFSLTLVRPNKLRMQVYQALVVCDGQQLHAAIEDLPGQVLAKKAPQTLTMESVYGDPLLASVLSSGITGPAPQPILLLEDDPLSFVLHRAEATVLGKPGTIAGRECHRVEIKRDYGTSVLWIDRESYLLWRIVFPTEQLRQEISRRGPVGNVSLVAEFKGAEFDREVEAKAFQFETPAGAELVKFFIQPDPAQLLGKKVPDFRFVDLEAKPVTPESLAGKTIVLKFWATWCGPCRESFPILEKVRQRYEGNDRIAFLAVSVDDRQVGNQELRDALSQWGANLPVLRDPDRNFAMLFKATAIPTNFVIDAKGVVQDVEQGFDPAIADPVAGLVEKIDKVLAGHDIYQAPLQAYRSRVEEYGRRLEASADSRPPEQPAVTELELPRAEIAQQSAPKTFKLTRLWKCTELASPGNIVVVGSADRSSPRQRLLVVDAVRSVAEVGLDGKLIATHPLDLKLDPETKQQELVTELRTAVGADGKRYVAALASGQQRFHLFDEHWNQVLSYPPDALENRHSGIADVQLADLDGDGTLAAYVGYWGLVGVQAVSLQGRRLWSNRSLSYVERLAITGPDAQGHRRLLCTSASDRLALIGPDGQRLGEVTLPGRLLRWVVAAELTGDSQPELCVLAAANLGESVAIGVDLQGRELWRHPLPKGVYQLPVVPIVAGRLLPGTAAEWLLLGADGSIQVIAADGKLLDRFNYGTAVAGLATAELDGRPLLLVSTPDGLEGWRVE